jgi:hypothetical protein
MSDLDLARRAVACKRWRWIGGMWWDAALGGTCPECHGAGGFRWHEADGSENGHECPCAGRVELYPGFRNDVFDARMKAAGVVPDLTDPATLGCLLALVREAWGDPSAHTEPTVSDWWRCAAGPYLFPAEPSEVAALVAALEAAP